MSTDTGLTIAVNAASLDNLVLAATATLQPGRPDIQTARREALRAALRTIVAERAIAQFEAGIDSTPDPPQTSRRGPIGGGE